MAEYEVSMTLKELNQIFNQFNEAVKRKDAGWVKLEYRGWQNLNRFFTKEDSYCPDDIVDITVKEHEIWVQNRATKKTRIAGRKPRSFSDFLLQEIRSKENNMTTSNTTTSSTITIDAGGSTSNYYTTTATPDYTIHTTPSYVYNNSWATIPTDIKDLKGVAINEDGIFINGKKVLTEEENMNTKDFNLNFDFGPVKDKIVTLSPFGIAIKSANAEGYCYYNPDTCEITDCTPFTFDTGKFLYKMPVAVSAIAVGDVIMHRGHPMFVKGYEDEEGRICVIDVAAAEEKFILPVKNMFGFNFVTKIISLLDMKNNGASAETPFGNLLPFLLMKDGKDLDPMILLFMNGSTNVFGAATPIGLNPMMLYMLTQEDSNLSKMLPFLLMQNTSQMN